ncbi:alpha/beta hydrolase fold-3 domain-containing protein [Pseudomassariella vexata]|uniref:Alpha/beta hydrolase fold-3 domain-containing protein n=1 Tax=Pseudomassariella vexata TaxID=1141098 RepID=A0A1Y2EEU4_9PEZI|nr:alpha/beta hydrolase fold-3 domain-containing protein [Pseudomassariella vexata]ORY69834.1 alpha/beta hydrolase fold-3 domain-containing protein [Pseudomassariella vexata]
MTPRTREELVSYGVVDPALAAELEKNPLRAPQPSDPYYGRDDHSAYREHRTATLREKRHLRYLAEPIPDEVEEEDRTVRMRDGEEIVVRVYRPRRKVEAGSPLIVMYHEGGWSMGDLTDEEVNCRLFSRDLGAVCVNVDYRLAPEYPFPTWINDAWDALQWTAQNAGELGANPSRGFIVGGGSAGGNISAVLAHLARDNNLSPPLTGQYLCVPVITCFMAPDLLPEKYRAEYLSHPAVTPNLDPVIRIGKSVRNDMNLTLKADLDSPLMAPFLFGERTEQGHKGVPPAYFQVCGLDPLRDEALIYERVLREENGIETRLDLYPGLGHYFWTNWPELESSRRFVEDTVRGMRWLLERGKGD